MHEMTAEAAAGLLDALGRQDVDVCVGGGWCVDALVGHQTRVHSDLDVWIPEDQFDRAIVAFVAAGVDRLYPWGGDRPWNFVLHDGALRRVDLHVYARLGTDRFRYGGADAATFPLAAISATGTIGGRPVRCESPEWSLRFHGGYPPRPEDHHDVALLCATFGLDTPEEYG